MEASSRWNRRKSYVPFFKLLPQFLNHILIKQQHMIYFSNESKQLTSHKSLSLQISFGMQQTRVFFCS